MGDVWGDQLPTIVLVSLQFVFAAMALLNRASLLKGMSPFVFLFYRQAIAALLLGPLAYFKREKSSKSTFGIKSLLLIFVTSFIGVVISQFTFFEGLYLASSSTANATINLTPALTFLMAVIMGVEQVSVKAVSSLAKIMGTIICAGGAICMAFLTGPKLLNFQLPQSNDSLILRSNILGGETNQAWLFGCVCLFASSFFWSLCLILQVPIAKHNSNPLSIAALMCFFSTLQSGVLVVLLEHDRKAWILSSSLELTSCIVSGVFGSAIQFFVISWCISLRGPLFPAIFSPLCTVITTVLACLFQHEELYIGRLLGAVAVIVGLYFVLWGKAQEMKHKLNHIKQNGTDKQTNIDTSVKVDLEQPLLVDDSSNNINKDGLVD